MPKFFVVFGLLSVIAFAEAPPITDPVYDTSGMEHSAVTPQFQSSFDRDKRRHTFIQLFDDTETLAVGTFGYHLAEFGTNHQHQLIVRGDNLITGKNLEQSVKLIKGVFAKPPKNKFYTVTSDGVADGYEKFLLKELISGQRREFPTDLFDGIITQAPPVKKPWRYLVKEMIFTTPMLAKDSPVDKSIYIVFGLHDDKAPKKKYFLAHLIWGHEKNFDQVVTAEFSSDVVIPNGSMMVIEDNTFDAPLKKGKAYRGKIGEQVPLAFTMTKEIHMAVFNENKPQ